MESLAALTRGKVLKYGKIHAKIGTVFDLVCLNLTNF